MASIRGRSDSPKPLGVQPGSKSPLAKSTNGTKTANHASRTKSASMSPSPPGSAARPRSRSRSMSLSRSGSGSRFSGSRSRSRSPRPKRARSYTASRSRSRSRSYSSYSSRTGSRDSVGGGSASKVVEVSKLTKNVTTQHIREIFGAYGAIKDVDLPIVRRIGSHRGTAIVTFESGKAAQKAISHMDRGQLDGSLISVRVPRPPSPPRGPAALRRGGNGYRAGPPEGNRYASARGPVSARRINSPPRRAFGGRSRSPPRRDFGGDGRAPASRPVRSRSPPYRRKRSLSRSLSRSPRRGVRRASPQYGARRGSPLRSSRRNRSYSRSSSSSYTRSSQSRSRSPRR